MIDLRWVDSGNIFFELCYLKLHAGDLLMKVLLMTVLICLAFNASADCPVKRPGELPVLPDGAVASDEVMYRGQLAAEKYLLHAEAYIGCGVMAPQQHLILVAKVEDFSRVYNDEVIEFQVRSNLLAEK